MRKILLAGTIEKNPDGNYKTRILSHEEIMQLEVSGTDISDKDFEIFSKDTAFRGFVTKRYSELQLAGIIPTCEGCSVDYHCCSSDEIREPRITPFETEKISRRFGLHPECITKYIVPEKGSGLWFWGYHGPAMVLKRDNDTCVFMYFKDNSCIRYGGGCLTHIVREKIDVNPPPVSALCPWVRSDRWHHPPTPQRQPGSFAPLHRGCMTRISAC